MKYLITDTAIIRLSETGGVIQDLSGSDCVELSDSNSFADSILLFPLNKFSFDRRLYIRAHGKISQPIEVNVVPFAVDGGTGSSSGTFVDDEDVASDDDANDFFDSIFGGAG